MTNSFLKTLVLLAAACGSSFARADELFSRTTIEAALNALTGGVESTPNPGFAASVAPVTAPAPVSNPVFDAVSAPVAAPAPAPVKLGLPQISEMLNAAGMEPQNDGEHIVVAKVGFDKWKFPVAITLSGDGERIHMAMMLARYDQKMPTADKLLALLASNRTHQPAFFSFSEERKQVELVSSIANDRPVIDAVRGELERLATVAGKTISLWEPNMPGAGNAPAGGTVIGKWAAARSQTEAFALLLNEDASFTLIFVKDGKPSRSEGKFTIGNNQLSLAANNGAKLAGNFAMTSENTFELVPGGNAAQKLTFNRAR